MDGYPFSLAPLPYPYGALAPCISAETVRMHHGRHQAAQVEALNRALAGFPQYHDWPLEKLLCGGAQLPEEIRPAVLRGAGGVFSHELYFDGMTASPACGCPVGRLAQAVDRCFGSFERLRDVMTQTALDRFGSGWCWLCCEPGGGLRVLSTPDQETPLPLGLRPVLALDVWEHAYCLDQKDRREEYVRGWWDLVDWAFAEENYLPIFAEKG